MHKSSPRSIASDSLKDGDKEKTLTPQRKHRKLMKDGTSEVWPESVERVFVEGLKAYWESPWATYSRGRSRWRNQFLVDWLQKHGVDRTKKQVASHIQVLRNMWKGEPEYSLVAGGEELFVETDHAPPVKSEDAEMSAVPGPGASTTSPSSTFSSPDYAFDQCLQMPASPHSDRTSPSTRLSSELPREAPMHHPPFDNFSRSDAHVRSDHTPLTLQYARPRLPSSHSHHVGDRSPAMFPGPSSMSSAAGSPPQAASSPMWNNGVVSTNSSVGSSPSLTCVTLVAEGLSPVVLPIEAPPATNGASSNRLAVRMKLHVPSIDDLRCPATMHGFHATVAFNGGWATSAVCATSVYQGTNKAVQDSKDLIPFTSPGMSNGVGIYTSAALPDSALSRCRWLEAVPTQIIQQLCLDGVTVAVLVYDIERSTASGGPSAELVSVQRKRSERSSMSSAATPPTRVSPTAFTTSTPMPYAYSPPVAQSFPSYFPHQSGRTDSMSLSCALTPVSPGHAPAYASRLHVPASAMF